MVLRGQSPFHYLEGAGLGLRVLLSGVQSFLLAPLGSCLTLPVQTSAAPVQRVFTPPAAELLLELKRGPKKQPALPTHLVLPSPTFLLFERRVESFSRTELCREAAGGALSQ